MIDNLTILGDVKLNASTDYQHNVPDAVQHGVAHVSRFLYQPMNRRYLNEFVSVLINRIGYEIYHQRVYKNPIKRKREDLLFGTTIEEIAFGFCDSHAYRDDWGSRDNDLHNLMKVHRPKTKVAFHTIDREQTYEISINMMELRAAFNSEFGLNNFVAGVMNAPYNTSEYHELCLQLDLIAEHERYHGFYKHQLSAQPTDEATGKEFLKAIQTYADYITTPNTLYNANDVEDMEVWLNPDELERSIVIYMLPEVKANLNVETLSGLFNLDLADIKYRIKTVPWIPIPGAIALLTVDDFWVCADYYTGMDEFRNPQTLTTNYYLNVLGVYSTSPFVPAILFTTAEGTSTPVVTQNLTAIALNPATANVEQGGSVDLSVVLTGTQTISPEGATIPARIKPAPEAVTWELAAVDGDAEPIDLDVYTYVDRFNTLHVASSVPVDAVITATATSTYTNPSGATPELVATGTYTVTERDAVTVNGNVSNNNRSTTKAAAKDAAKG